MTGTGEIKWSDAKLGGENSGRDFLHGAWKAAKRPAKPPNPAETGRLVSLSYQPGQSTGCRGGPPGGAGLQPSGSRGKGILGRCPRLGWGGPLGLGGLDLGRRLRDGGGSCRGSGETSEDTRYTLAGALRSAAGVARSSSIRFCFGYKKLAGRLVQLSLPDRRCHILPLQCLNHGRERLMRRDLISLCRNWWMP